MKKTELNFLDIRKDLDEIKDILKKIDVLIVDLPTRIDLWQWKWKMPWTGKTFKKHNKKLTSSQSGKAAKIATAILRKTGDEGKAIRIANSKFKKKKKK